jgi:2-polyprenyl-3-methyl-5-hydroxy-6-metoxy-1,4-benzoquinol methylase
MEHSPDYEERNRRSWNARTDYHLASPFYDMEGFLKGRSSLNDIELALLGRLESKRVLHLQCHFGQDSLSLARMGAQVTGVDLSDRAIEKARSLAEQLGLDANFICCNIYDLPKHLDESFDVVFTSYGVIGWLPDLSEWARIISKFLRKGGRFVMAEFHPFVWMFDDQFTHIAYNYFNSGPIVETESGTYADRNAPIELEYVMWNHSLSDVINALLGNGLVLDTLKEHDYSPYDCFQQTEAFAPNKFRIKHFGNRVPMVFSLAATNP